MSALRTTSLFLVFLGGCASTVPPELTSARTTYERARQGPTAQLDPADLDSARKTLDEAEQSFQKDGDTQATKDIAYTAERRTQIAEVRARSLVLETQKAQIVDQMHATQAAQARTATDQLHSAQAQLQAQGTALSNERDRREAAEKRAAEANAALAGFASVKQETRGMVITLSGSVLFASDKSELLPSAQSRLSDVADALSKQDPDSKIVVEGYADSQGAAAHNLELSQRRAESVRSYLVSHGVAQDRITSKGMGTARPIADNATPEGRANNRRVEIVVQPAGNSKP